MINALQCIDTDFRDGMTLILCGAKISDGHPYPCFYLFYRSVVTARCVLIMLLPIGENGFAKNLPQERIQGDRGENHMKLGSGHFELGQIDPTWGGVQPVQGEAVRGRWEDGGALRHRAQQAGGGNHGHQVCPGFIRHHKSCFETTFP